MRTPPSPPSVLRATVVLLAVRLHLKCRGLSRSLAWARRWGVLPRERQEEPEQVIAHTLGSVAAAAAFFLGRAVCLERSLTLYILLRRRGVAVDLRLGVQAFPFLAHAWTEHEGRAIGEDLETIRSLLVLPDPSG
jgi:hypothetical protein